MTTYDVVFIVTWLCVVGVHAVCDCSRWRVAGRTRAHVLQHQTCWKKQTGKERLVTAHIFTLELCPLVQSQGKSSGYSIQLYFRPAD